MELTEEDVREILKLLEESSFDYMQLEVGDLKLVVSKGSYVPTAPDRTIPANSPRAGNPAANTQKTPKRTVSKAKGKIAQSAAMAAPKKGLIPITAPMVGTFYTTSEPGAPPFVTAGARINEDTTVGLIEVMKVFTAVKSGARGVVAEILVQNGQFVEHGQTLFLVKPAGSGAKD